MIRKITGYKILASKNPAELSEAVSQLIATGWEPQGGPCVLELRNESTVLAQAMVEVELTRERL